MVGNQLILVFVRKLHKGLLTSLILISLINLWLSLQILKVYELFYVAILPRVSIKNFYCCEFAHFSNYIFITQLLVILDYFYIQLLPINDIPVNTNYNDTRYSKYTTAKE